MIRSTAAALALALVTGAGTAHAQSGFYVGAAAGANWLADTDHAWPPAGVTALGWDLGFALSGSVGYAYGNGIRVEAEFSYRDNDADTLSGPAFGTVNAGGRARTYGLMLNALYDFNFGWPIIPYVGAGIGYQWHQFGSVRSNVVGGTADFDGDFGNFAYQAIIGAAVPIAAVPGLSLTLDYRFMYVLEDDITGSFTTTAGARSSVTYKAESENHTVFVGLRYRFGAAPAAPAAAAAPAPARTFLVFFDWNRDNLTDRARAIIAEAAQAARRTGTTRIEVAGHADRTGTAQYNQRLSERRAENVAAELVRNGIGRNEITTVGFGFDRPLVPTAAGVREPQNRRVEIVLR
jgi:outer membrane protein OmpA-like peptidoglycan-associated protein